ncbi:MAG: type II secretion system F family protein [Eubacteriales bacterium]|nr:type II secretion system F family protein [Eubacteriales bacterium]
MSEQKFTNEETGSVCQSLAYLIHSGISAASALSLVAEDENRPKYKEILLEMATQADEGAYLSEVFRNSGRFEDYVCEMISVGEKTGRTEEALNSLGTSCARRASLDRQLKSALVYPAVLLLIMLAVISVLLIYVLPIFDEVYSQLGSGLTGMAGSLLNVGKALGSAVPLLIAVFVAAVVFLVLFSVVPSFRDKVLNLFWKSGKDKGVSAKISAARFAQGLSMCICSGISADEAVSISAALPGTDGSVALKAEQCRKLIADGASLASALRDSGLLPSTESRMLEAGILGGSGDLAVEQISARLTEESDSAISDSVAKIEPAVVVITSLLVGLVILSVMLPLVNIMAAIG